MEAIRKFIANDSDAYADLVVARLLESVERLEQFPRSGLPDELNAPGLAIVPRQRAKPLPKRCSEQHVRDELGSTKLRRGGCADSGYNRPFLPRRVKTKCSCPTIPQS
jgi:hypothetical protein